MAGGAGQRCGCGARSCARVVERGGLGVVGRFGSWVVVGYGRGMRRSCLILGVIAGCSSAETGALESMSEGTAVSASATTGGGDGTTQVEKTSETTGGVDVTGVPTSDGPTGSDPSGVTLGSSGPADTVTGTEGDTTTGVMSGGCGMAAPFVGAMDQTIMVEGVERSYILALVSERIGADLRTTTFDHLLKLSLEYFGGKRTGDLISRLGSESDRICVFLSLHALDFITDVLVMLMTAAILFSINPWLALTTLLPLPFIVWLIHIVREKLRTGFERLTRIWSEVTNVLSDTIPGIRVVKAFAQEEREGQRFLKANKYNLAQNDRLNKIWALFTPTVTLLTELGLLVVWGFGIYQVSKHEITVGVLTAFLAYIGRFYTRLDSMSRIVSVTQKAAAAAKRIFNILDHVSSVPEPASSTKRRSPSAASLPRTHSSRVRLSCAAG